MNTRGRRSPHPQPSCKPAGGRRGGENSWQEEPGGDGGVQGLRSFLSKNTCIQCPVSCGLGTSWIVRKGRVFKSKLSDCWNLLSVLDTALEAKVLANKDESKCFKPLIAVIRPVRDRYVDDWICPYDDDFKFNLSQWWDETSAGGWIKMCLRRNWIRLLKMTVTGNVRTINMFRGENGRVLVIDNNIVGKLLTWAESDLWQQQTNISEPKRKRPVRSTERAWIIKWDSGHVSLMSDAK